MEQLNEMIMIDNTKDEVLKNTNDKNIEINYNGQLTPMDYMAIESIRKIQNPFQMICVEDVMNDLHICRTIAYKLFQNKDFPSINIGKSNQVMLLPYLIWKMNRRTNFNKENK